MNKRSLLYCASNRKTLLPFGDYTHGNMVSAVFGRSIGA